MAWYSFLTGVDVQKTIDTVAKGVDYSIYTEQEQKEMNERFVAAKLTAIGKASVARRVIAIAITAESIILVNVTVALHLLGWSADAQFVKTLLIEFMLQPFLAVVGFYFLTQIVGASKK